MTYYIIEVEPGQYAKRLYMTDYETVVMAVTTEFASAQAVMLAEQIRLHSVRKNYPKAKYLEVVLDHDGRLRLGSQLNHAKIDEPDNPWMILQELRTFAMACDAEERSIQPHEILDRLSTRGN